MKYKLLALDIDGTLVPEHTNELSEPLKNAIREIKDDIAIAIVSARARKDQQLIIDALGLHGRYHVSENGTRVIRPDGDLEYTLYLPFAEVQEIKKRTEKLCESIGYCVEGNWLQAHPETADDCITTLSLIPPKENAQKISDLIHSLPTKYAITVANHWSDQKLAVILISHKDASKGGGLRAIQKILNITPEETIAVGDGASDVPMMEYAAVKVAMGNAEDKLKTVATHIVSPVTEDGVVEVIRRFILSTK
jgi:HAD superfamily hydrolase (TIGR01484 family)